MKNRINSLQKSSVVPSYHREKKSRQADWSMRYTNSLPTSGSVSSSQIPSHLRHSIDQLASDSSEPVRSSLMSNYFKQPRVIEYYEDTTPQANESASDPDNEYDNILFADGTEFVNADIYRNNISTQNEKKEEKKKYEEFEDHYLESPPNNDDSINNRVEWFHLEDLGSQIIEEKAEEEETTTNQVFTNKEVTEPFSSVIEVYNSGEDTQILDEASVSRRSINSSVINIKKAKIFGNSTQL